jgi:hypothetical protein
MRALVLGQTPRAPLFTSLLRAGDYTIVDSPAEADILFVLQRESGSESRVTRQEVMDELKTVVPYISRPVIVCLVSIEPNTAWPIGMSHAVRTSLLLAAAYPLKITRAHLTALPDPDFQQLILGAKEDAMASLADAFSPLLPAECAVQVSSMYEAERDAEYRPDLA